MDKVQASELKFHPLDKVPHDNIQGFSCGNGLINSYLKTSIRARKDHELGLASTTVVTHNETVVAFFTTKCAELVIDKTEAEQLGFQEAAKIPGIEVMYFAVDQNHKRRGIGTAVLMSLIWDIYEISQKIGCRYVFLWSVPEEDTIAFYESLNFQLMDKESPEKLRLMRFQLPQGIEDEEY